MLRKTIFAIAASAALAAAALSPNTASARGRGCGAGFGHAFAGDHGELIGNGVDGAGFGHASFRYLGRASFGHAHLQRVRRRRPAPAIICDPTQCPYHP